MTKGSQPSIDITVANRTRDAVMVLGGTMPDSLLVGVIRSTSVGAGDSAGFLTVAVDVVKRMSTASIVSFLTTGDSDSVVRLVCSQTDENAQPA